MSLLNFTPSPLTVSRILICSFLLSLQSITQELDESLCSVLPWRAEGFDPSWCCQSSILTPCRGPGSKSAQSVLPYLLGWLGSGSDQNHGGPVSGHALQLLGNTSRAVAPQGGSDRGRKGEPEIPSDLDLHGSDGSTWLLTCRSQYQKRSIQTGLRKSSWKLSGSFDSWNPGW